MPRHTPKERAKRVSRKISNLRKEGKTREQAVAQAIKAVGKRLRFK